MALAALRDNPQPGTLTVLLPVFTTIIGGVLTAGGGLIANYVLQASARRTERIQFLRGRLEQIYVWINQTIAWMEREVEVKEGRSISLMFGGSKQTNVLDNPISELLMTVDFYFPTLSRPAHELAEYREKLTQEFDKATPVDDPSEARQARQEAHQQARSIIDDAKAKREEMMAEVRTLANRLT